MDDQPQLPRRLLGVWAHPDDETYLSAGLMARVADRGDDVVVLSATHGEGGFADDDPRSSGRRAALRRRELRVALGTLGVRRHHVGRWSDGTLADVSVEELSAWVADALVRVRPDTVVTFGPDGGTGHPDHVAVSRAVTAAWRRERIGDLLYSCNTADWYDEFRPLHDRIGMWMGDEPDGTPTAAIARWVVLSEEELDRKRRALAGHASQTQAVAEMMGEPTYRRWISRESFRRPTAAELADAGGVVADSAA